MSSAVYRELQARGFFAQVTDEAAVCALLDAGPQLIYTGYDPTGDSLHVGHLVTLMAFKHLQRAGHRPLVVLGGGTAQVGDPSGRDAARPLLAAATLAHNIEALRAQLAQLLAGPAVPLFVNNAEWLTPLRYVEFLRDIGRHFSVNRMLSAEAYRARLGRGLSFLEFNYQILQAYDFAMLRRAHGCRLQLGGDDQWGNILAGVDLARRLDAELVHGLTYPLLTTADGAKMGKTAGGAIWLDAAKLTPFAFYQYFVDCHDDDVLRLLRLFTFLPLAEIEAVADRPGGARNALKSILAYEVCALVHGAAAAAAAHAAAQGAFGGRTLEASLLPSSAVPRAAAVAAEAAAAMPATTVSQAQLDAGLTVVEILVLAGLAPSKQAARRLVEQGAVALDTARVAEPTQRLAATDFVGGAVVLRAGKKRAHRLLLG